MGTTCTSLAIIPEGALIAHVGDSRAYRLRSKWLEQLTFDHSLVWEMAEASPDGEAPGFIPKNIITRSLGPHESVNVDLEGPYSVEAGDVFLVCSDGLSGQLDDEELGAILRTLEPEEALQTMIDIANLRGGPDNITAIVVRIVDEDISDESSGASDVSESTNRGEGGSKTLGKRTGATSTRDDPEYAMVSLAGDGDRCGPSFLVWVDAVAAGIDPFSHWPRSGHGNDRILACEEADNALELDECIGGPYGNGPYRNHDALPSRRICDQFAELTERLRPLAEHYGWQIDWKGIDSICHRGEIALQQGNYETSIVEYSLAFRTMGEQIRQQKTDTFDGGSNVFH